MNMIQKPKKYKVAIVIITHNALDFVKLCLNSIELYSTVFYEIIIVDNCSARPLCNYLEKRDFKSYRGENKAPKTTRYSWYSKK
jgi:glycosyltransferase involved in cell wall biosynthesis